METREQRANPMSNRSRHWGVVIDAGLNARRPSEDPGLRVSHGSGSNSSYVGGGLLRPGVWSAPPASTISVEVDDALAVHRDQGQCRMVVSAADDPRRLQLQDQACEWLQDDRLQCPGDEHGGAQSNLYTTTRSSSFRATPRHDADHHLHDDDTTSDFALTTTCPDRSVYPHEDVYYQQSSWTGAMSSNGPDDEHQHHVDPEPCDDIYGTGPDQPTDPGRPAGRATDLLL